MTEIKSAAEIAAEKLAAIGDPTPEERLKWKYGPLGEQLAARFLKDAIDLAGEIRKVDEKGRDMVMAGVNDILLRNITLPRNDAIVRTNKKAMEGIKSLKQDKAAAEAVFANMQHVLDHYVNEGETQRKQAYEQLKTEMEQRFQQALRAQTGVSNGARMNINVEAQPQFQDEWQRLQGQLEAQYVNLLDDYKQQLAAIR